MHYLSDQLISIFLTGLSALFLMIILFWGIFKRIFGIGNSDYNVSRNRYDRLRGIHMFFRILLIAFILVSFAYYYLPASKQYLYPIKWLNNNYINMIGFIMLILAFVLVLINQVKLDKTLHHFYLESKGQSDATLVPKTEDRLLQSILLVYTGMFIVVSTLATFLLLAAALLFYYLRSSDRRFKVKTPLF